MGYFASFSEFLEMGGHGLYVWLSYTLVLAILSYNVASPWLSRKRIIAAQKRRLRREGSLR